MKLTFPRAAISNVVNVLRRAGYSPFVDPKSHESSYVLRLTKGFYPRFHLYATDRGENITFDVHLDQKQPSYGEGHMHAGEYDGPTIEKECARIERAVSTVLFEEM